MQKMGNKIIISGKTIGLFGLEAALSQVKRLLDLQKADLHQAARMLLELVEKKNYVPFSSREDYLRAFEKLLEGTVDSEGEKPIRILGPGCVGCDRLEKLVLEALAQQGIAADIYHVTDKDEIWRYGVTRTPALLIGEEVLCAGTLPSSAQIHQWIRDRFSSP